MFIQGLNVRYTYLLLNLVNLKAECKAVFTANYGVRAGRLIPLKETVEEAVKKCPSIKNVFIMKRTEDLGELGPLDVLLDEVCSILNDKF